MRTFRAALFMLGIIGLLVSCSSSPQPVKPDAVKSTAQPDILAHSRKIVAPEVMTYRVGTMNLFQNALRCYLKSDCMFAEKEALKTLEYEPRCIEAKWLLANIYHDRGEFGRMVDMFETLGIREAKESLFAQEIVARGSKGYVVEVQDSMVKLDYCEDDGVMQDESFIIYDEGSVLQHPITLEILYVEKRQVAEAEIRSVYGSYSTAEVVTSPAIPIKRGMRIIPKSEYSESVKSGN